MCLNTFSCTAAVPYIPERHGLLTVAYEAIIHFQLEKTLFMDIGSGSFSQHPCHFTFIGPVYVALNPTALQSEDVAMLT